MSQDKPPGSSRKGRRKLRARLKNMGRGAQNALELMRKGRLGAPWRAPYDEVLRAPTFNLRRYLPPQEEPPAALPQPVILVPPLMVSSEIYDISPELSAVGWLTRQGVDVWLVDFGAPEEIEGGQERTLDDHVLAVVQAIEEVHRLTGEPAHLMGYSQGGMFVYQATAYLRSRYVASLVTFGSPVDMWRNLPGVHAQVTGRVLEAASNALARPLEQLPGLPSALTSHGFKLLNVKKEMKQMMDFLGLLHDREALEAREPKRRFLGGEGFVLWPGPALRDLIDQVVVDNRMASGGMVVNGRTVALADITVPVLCFIGLRDDLVLPAAVRALHKAAPHARIWEREVPTGHFGLVVGSYAMGHNWPAALEWLSWHMGQGEPPAFLEQPQAPQEATPPERASGLLYDATSEILDQLWRGLGRFSVEFSHTLDTMRWQLPRLARMESLQGQETLSLSRMLAEQARAIPEEPFLVWEGRAFSYQQANARVNRALVGLYRLGVRPGGHVGVLMGTHPDVLTVVTALNRMGAVAVMLHTEARGATLEHALQVAPVTHLVVDPERALAALEYGQRPVICLGGQEAPQGCQALEPQMDHDPELLDELALDQGRGEDLALLMFTSGTTGLPRAARLSNLRWVTAALGAAAACQLTPRDTVYCCLPLHHATGLLLAVSGALAGGARLALAPSFSVARFWPELRRAGATVVFYVGELCRYLLSAPPREDDKRHPVRLLVGNGMRAEVWQEVLERFGPLRVLEFYGSTEGNVALVNLSGEKVGSVGRPLLGGSAELLRYDVEAEALVRDAQGRCCVCEPEEPGMLIARVGQEHPLGRFEGYTDHEATGQRVLRGVFEPEDAWFVTGDLLRRDEDGDFWFVDRVGDTFRWKGENVSTQQVASLVMRDPAVALAAVYGVALPAREGRVGVAAVELAPGQALDGARLFSLLEAHLVDPARPRFVRVVPSLSMTASFKPRKLELQRQGVDPRRVQDPLYVYDEQARAYRPLEAEGWAEVLARL